MIFEKFHDGRVTAVNADCLEALKEIEPGTIDAVVTDPPYELGFMGRDWDRSGIVFRKETWEAVYRTMKPGAHLVAFGAPRNAHRLTCAIEDAGFEIRDVIFWVFGSGFPKSLNISKAIDATASPDAENWDGWGTALKPAYEPIILARKPLIGTVAENVLKHGTGGLNIDACRVETKEDLGGGAYSGSQRHDGDENWRFKNGGAGRTASEVFPSGMGRPGAKAPGEFVQPEGRWPANIMHDGSEEVREAFPDAPGQQRAVDESFAPKEGTAVYGDYGPRPKAEPREETDGSAARFFAEFPEKARWPANIVHDGSDEVMETFPETGVSSGGKGEASKKTALNGDVYEGGYSGETLGQNAGGLGDSGNAGRYFAAFKQQNGRDGEESGEPVEAHRLFYTPKAGDKDRLGSAHPTIKPIALMRWLCRLITPPGGTILDPFAGTGTTGEAAFREGFDSVLIEKNEEYFADIERRMELLLVSDSARKAAAKTRKAARKGAEPKGTLL